MSLLNFNNTCPLIDEGLEDIESLLLNYFSTSLTDDVMSDINSPIDEIKQTNIEMREAADAQLQEKIDKIDELQDEIADLKDELEEANDEIRTLTSDLSDL